MEERKILRYDPQTGAPIYADPTPAPTAAGSAAPLRFDPQTGAPIYANTPAQTPVAPVTPVTPSAPQASAPVTPVTPVAPQAPTPSVSPFAPTEPIRPQAAAQPAAPVQPQAPVPPQAPAQPQAAAQPKVVGFNPQTGAPIYEQSAPQAAAQPATPVQPTYAQSGQPQGAYAQPAGQAPQGFTAPRAPKAKAPKGKIIGISAACAVVVVGGAVAVMAATGTFKSDSEKVQDAFTDTFEDRSELGGALDIVDILDSGSYTLTVNANIMYENEGVSGTAQLGQSSDGIFAYVNGSYAMGDGSYSLEASASVQADAADLCVGGYDFVYTYDEPVTGFLGENLDISELSQIGPMVEEFLDGTGENNATYEAVEDSIDDFLDNLTYSDAPKRSCLVNGSTHNCSGYMVTLTSYDMKNLLQSIENVALQSSGVSTSALADYMDMDVDDYFDEIYDELDDMPAVTLYFYLYKGELAEVMVSVEGESVEIQFQGGEYRTQNMALVADGVTMAQITGSTSGSTEMRSVQVMGETYASWSYDSSSGALTISSDYDDSFTLVANIKKSGDTVSFSLTDLTIDGTSLSSMIPGFSLSGTLEKGMNVTSVSGGQTIDLNTAAEDQLETIVLGLAEQLGLY